ncbi:MAG: hypothetical protein M2R45_05477 [Verrucomicrobia subdivision 3 bacterium]|nr:hypothetical protein [Limisphaerales bacterium]
MKNKTIWLMGAAGFLAVLFLVWRQEPAAEPEAP